MKQSLPRCVLFRFLLGDSLTRFNQTVVFQDLADELIRLFVLRADVGGINLEIVLEIPQDLILVIIVFGDKIHHIDMNFDRSQDELLDQVRVSRIQIDCPEECLVDVFEDVDILTSREIIVDMLRDNHKLGETQLLG